MKISPREREVLEVIRKYREEFGFAPTNADIGRVLKITRQAVNLHVNRLVSKGALKRVIGEARSLVAV